jgi:hypothetical protein
LTAPGLAGILLRVNDLVELSWQPEATDYVEAFKARTRRGVIWLALTPLMLIAIGVGFAALADGQPGPAIVLILIGLAVPLLVPAINSMSTKGLWRLTPAMHEASRVSVSREHGITVEGPVLDMRSRKMVVTTSRAVFPWQAVDRVSETKRIFVLQLTGYKGKVFFLLAKRGTADVEALRAALLRPSR